MSGKPTLLIVSAVFAATIGLTTRSADASSITNFYSFSGTTTDTMAVQPFNPAWGTLNSVDVNIGGVLSVSGATGLNLLPGPGGALIPNPYAFQVTVTQNFFGLGGRYFDFTDNATFTFAGNASGAGEGFAFVSNYSYGFTFNGITDLSGFVIPSTSTTAGALVPPLSGVSGPLADFLQTVVPLDQISFVQFASGQSFGGTALPLSISGVNTTGQLQITYNYTAAVPEPATWTLVMFGAGAALVARRRRRG